MYLVEALKKKTNKVNRKWRLQQNRYTIKNKFKKSQKALCLQIISLQHVQKSTLLFYVFTILLHCKPLNKLYACFIVHLTINYK